MIRHLEPKVGDGMSVYFTWANAGKRSITVNLRDPRGVELVGRLAMVSDVVLENFRPGVLEQFGLDASTLLGRNPALVYCSINGWGTANSWSNRRAYAAMVQAEVGRVELDARLRDAADGAEPARRRRHHAWAARGERHRRGAVPPRAVGARRPRGRVDGRGAAVHRRVDDDRAHRVPRSSGSPTPGTTPSSRWPTAPASPSWATRTPGSPRSRRR